MDHIFEDDSNDIMRNVCDCDSDDNNTEDSNNGNYNDMTKVITTVMIMII